MSDRTSIEWTDATWNPLRGCTRVSQGCVNCYAEVMAARFSGPGQWGEGLAQMVRGPGGKVDHRWTGKVVLAEDQLDQPLRWRRPRKIFVNSTSDLFHESVPDEWIDRIFAVMALCPQHTFQVLTKRPERMRAYMAAAERRLKELACDMACEGDWPIVLSIPPIMVPPPSMVPKGYRVIDLTIWPLPNVWLGTSAEDQATADARIPHLLATPAAVRFLSAEPLLGPLDLVHFTKDFGVWLDFLHWVIVGGESGPGARPMHPDWARSLRDQCLAAGVAYFHKQNGMWLHDSSTDAERWDWDDADQRGLLHVWPDGSTSIRLRKQDAGRLLDGRTWDEMPGGMI